MAERPIDSLRNRIAHRLANLVLRIATPHYRDFIGGAIRYGMNAAARDDREGRPAPQSWTITPTTSYRDSTYRARPDA